MSPRTVISGMHLTLAPYAVCETGCGWQRNGEQDARNAAKDHVRRTGHVVNVVVEIRDTYRPEVRFR